MGHARPSPSSHPWGGLSANGQNDHAPRAPHVRVALRFHGPSIFIDPRSLVGHVLHGRAHGVSIAAMFRPAGSKWRHAGHARLRWHAASLPSSPAQGCERPRASIALLRPVHVPEYLVLMGTWTPPPAGALSGPRRRHRCNISWRPTSASSLARLAAGRRDLADLVRERGVMTPPRRRDARPCMWSAPPSASDLAAQDSDLANSQVPAAAEGAHSERPTHDNLQALRFTG